MLLCRLLKYAHIHRQIWVFHCIVHHTQGYRVQYAVVGCVFVRIFLNPCFSACIHSHYTVYVRPHFFSFFSGVYPLMCCCYVIDCLLLTYIHTHTHTYIHTYKCYTRYGTYIHTYIHTYKCYTHYGTYIHTYMHTYKCYTRYGRHRKCLFYSPKLTCMHAHIHTYIQMLYTLRQAP